jgi:hypothetical protein
MQRHFSNRGEALAEAAAAKMMAGRHPTSKSVLVPRSGKRPTLGPWQPQASRKEPSGVEKETTGRDKRTRSHCPPDTGLPDL